jgi:hypothetical protein
MPRIGRLRALPWAVVLEVAAVASRHWREIDERDRRRMGELVRKSRGRPGNLSPRERAELRRLVGALDLPRLGRELLPFGRAGRRR